MAGWSRDDAQPAIRRDLQIVALPRFHSKAVSAEALGAFCRSQDEFCRLKRLASFTVKIVEVMVVTKQDIVDWREIFQLNRRCRKLVECDRSRGLVPTSWVECGISQDSGSIQL